MVSKESGNISLGTDNFGGERNIWNKLRVPAERKGISFSCTWKRGQRWWTQTTATGFQWGWELSQPTNNETLSWMPKGSCAFFTLSSFLKTDWRSTCQVPQCSWSFPEVRDLCHDLLHSLSGQFSVMLSSHGNMALEVLSPNKGKAAAWCWGAAWSRSSWS